MMTTSTKENTVTKIKIPTYTVTAVFDGYKIITDFVDAKSKKEAKAKFREKHPKCTSVIVESFYTGEPLRSFEVSEVARQIDDIEASGHVGG